MSGTGRGDGGDLAAGSFAAWLSGMQRALRDGTTSEVPCGSCTACCTSSQFVHIAPDETETLARVPRELQFPAPGRPTGHVVLGYDEHGCCPMLVDHRCSIYEHRPRTCRTYDCRVFAATGLEPDLADTAIARQARRWRFTFATEEDERGRAALTEAVEYVRAGRDGAVPSSPTQLAVRAVERADAFRPREPH